MGVPLLGRLPEGQDGGGGMMAGLGTKHITLRASVSSSVIGGWLSAHNVDVKQASGVNRAQLRAALGLQNGVMRCSCLLMITGASKP